MSLHALSIRGAMVLVSVALLAGCQEKSTGTVKLNGKKNGTVVATVGDSTITVEELEERINAQGPFARPRFQEVTKRREFLDGLIRQELLAQEALRRGYADDPEVQDAVRKVMVQKLTRQEYDSLVKPEDIKAEDIKKYYDEHPDEFHKPESARCSAVVLNKGSDAAAARKRAEAALKEIKDGMAKKPDPTKPPSDPFRDVVMKSSDDNDSKPLGGDLRYLTRKEMDDKYGPTVGEACFGLANITDMSGVVEGKDAFFVLKSTGRRKALDRTLEQVESQIRNRLFREKRADAFNSFIDKLKDQAGVKVDEEKLAAMKLNPPAPGTPGAPATAPGATAPPAAGPGGAVQPPAGMGNTPQPPAEDPHAGHAH